MLLILTVFSIKIFSPSIGCIFLALMILGKGEFMLPSIFYGWTLAFAAGSLLLSHQSFRWVKLGCAVGLASSFIAFLIQSLMFSKLQLIQLIHPQLQSGTRYRTVTQELLSALSYSPQLWPLCLIGAIAGVLLLVWVFAGKFWIQKFGCLLAAGVAYFFLLSILAGAGAFFAVCH